MVQLPILFPRLLIYLSLQYQHYGQFPPAICSLLSLIRKDTALAYHVHGSKNFHEKYQLMPLEATPTLFYTIYYHK
jgi:hypothetical protein